MEIIHGGAGTGKTTKLIQRIKEFGGVLVVHSRDAKKCFIQQGILAEDQVLCFDEIRRVALQGKKYYIDNIEFFIEKYSGPGCEGFSMDTPDVMIDCKSLDY